MVGETISHYRIIAEIGAGGMGVVYKAEDLRLGRLVALKFLPPQLVSDLDAKRRFFQEARTASAIDHVNVCTIHDIEETTDGRVFLSMAYCDGETLKKRLERGPLTAPEAVRVRSPPLVILAMPKSSSLASPSVVTMMLPGFTSRWTMPA